MKLTKTTIATIALLLILSITVFVTITPSVNAEDVGTEAYLAVSPNPVGVNQWIYVTIWLMPLPPTNQDVFHELEVTITKPDGTTETKVMNTYTHGGNFFAFTPTEIGTYKFQMSYPGEHFDSRGLTYTSSTTPVTELVVQQAPVEHLPEVPPPTDYWTRPINPENREWWKISGNWLQRGYNATYMPSWPAAAVYNPYSQAVRSAHVMWTKEADLGGLVGGDFGTFAYYGGQSYEWKLTPPIIINGRLYYNAYKHDIYGAGFGLGGFVCVDLRTGEELWRNTEARIDVGQIYNYDSGNQHGALAYLGRFNGPNWEVYHAFTGELILTFEEAMSGGTIVYDDIGTMYAYFLDGQNDNLVMWNSTKAFDENGMILSPGTGVGLWRPQGGTYDWRKGIEMSVTLPHWDITIGGTTYYPAIRAISGDVIMATAGTWGQQKGHLGYSLKDGTMLWAFDRTSGDRSFDQVYAYGEGIYVQYDATNRQFVAYDLNTGLEKWVSDPGEYPWSTYYEEGGFIANGKLYHATYSGYVTAYDIMSGEIEWKFSSGDAGYETPFGTWPFFHGLIMADGVLYAAAGEHSPTMPLYKGEKLFAIDAETGEGIWNITGLYMLEAIADGYLLGVNAYDNRIYCYGKGPSETTVEAPLTAIPLGSNVMIRGTVTDQSAGAKDTPAISDKDMTEWMEYLYMQKPMPEHAQGVTVKVSAYDPNGNYQDIGTVTADAHGNFGMSWVPPVPGAYYILAEFEGSESYGSSSATTYFVVDPAPSPAQPIEPEPSEAPFITTEVAIIAAVAVAAVIAIVSYLVIKKRK